MSIPLKAVTGAVPLTVSLTLALGTGVAEARTVPAGNGEATASPEQSAPRRPDLEGPAARPVQGRSASERSALDPSNPGASERGSDIAFDADSEPDSARADEAGALPEDMAAHGVARLTAQAARVRRFARAEESARTEHGASGGEVARTEQTSRTKQAARPELGADAMQGASGDKAAQNELGARAGQAARPDRTEQAARPGQAARAAQGRTLHSRVGRAELGAQMLAARRRAVGLQRARLARRWEARGARAVAYAMRQLGRPYVWGGNGRRGFDCSGLTQQAWRHAGIKIPRIAADQFRRTRPHVPVGRLKAGDLVFFHGLGHVGIYTGRGWFIHAPHTGSSVKFQRLRGWYRSQFVGAARPGWKTLPAMPKHLSQRPA